METETYCVGLYRELAANYNAVWTCANGLCMKTQRAGGQI